MQVESLTFALKPLSAKKEGYDYAREMTEYPSNPTAVAKFFSSVFSDKIAITEKGWKSLDDCRTDPSVLWDALFSIVSILYDELEMRDNFSEACANYSRRAPFECSAGNSSTTNKNSSLDKQYIDYYEGKEISIKPHIKKGTNASDGKFLRIYFCYVRERAKIVIGTIGKHLDTAGTMHQN